MELASLYVCLTLLLRVHTLLQLFHVAAQVSPQIRNAQVQVEGHRCSANSTVLLGNNRQHYGNEALTLG